MANFGMFSGGLTLKALLENPDLQSAPVLGGNSEEKKKDVEGHYDAGSAFLGPNIWDKTYDNIDINLEYMDLDEFLSENGIPINGDPLSSPDMSNIPPSPTTSQSDSNQSAISQHSKAMPSPPQQIPMRPQEPMSPQSPPMSTSSSPSPGKVVISSPSSPQTGRNIVDFNVSPDDLNLLNGEGEENFDPTKRAFSEEELKPQPMIKKSKKVFVHEENKDDKYWCRRKKNNVAAKRSRDARRIKENQIAMRASFLEKENGVLRSEMDKVRAENLRLKTALAKYEPASSS